MLRSSKQSTFYLFLSMFLAAFSTGAIMTYTEPQTASTLTFVFLYASVFIFVTSLATLVGLGFRQALARTAFLLNFGISFRQALLLAVLLTASIILSSQGLLYWWVEATLIMFLVCLEAFFNLKI